ncbi:MAG: DUF6348 family protein [Actinomycetaceae bacterium]|nr:DUF6348 family protein [Actinomycetaceae bacterium]
MTEAVGQLFRMHGYDPVIDTDGWMHLNFAHPISIFATAEVKDQGNLMSSLCEVFVKVPSGKIFCEGYMSLGSTVPQVLDQAMECFSCAGIHSILEAFDNANERCERFYWTTGGRPVTVYRDGILMRGIKPDDIRNDFTPDGYFDLARKVIERAHLEPGFHFFRTYYANIDGEPAAYELRIDDVNQESAEQDMIALPWKKVDEFYSVRQFMVLKVD